MLSPQYILSVSAVNSVYLLYMLSTPFILYIPNSVYLLYMSSLQYPLYK